MYLHIQGVPAARQKLMAKGAWKGILKDDIDLSGCDIKDGQQVHLPPFGSASTLPLRTRACATSICIHTTYLVQSTSCDETQAKYTAVLVIFIPGTMLRSVQCCLVII